MYAMTLFDRETFNFYMEGAKALNYRLMPMDVSTIADDFRNIYTYAHRPYPASLNYLNFAIGEVKET